jgi:hypothetical protein
MTRYLYTIEPILDRPDIAWVSFEMPLKSITVSTLTPNILESVGVVFLKLDGEVAPHHHGAITVLSPVGSYEDSKGLLDLITPLLVEMATKRIPFDSIPWMWIDAIGSALSRRPFENALWILKATPEELQSWAETLGRRS